MTSAYLTLERRTEAQAKADIRAHRLSTLKLLEAAYDYAHDCEQWSKLDDLRTRINRLKNTLGLDAITTGNADWEAWQDELKREG